MELNDKVYYTGEFTKCQDYQYKIVYVWAGGWYDLEAVNPDILTHYTEILSVRIEDIKAIADAKM